MLATCIGECPYFFNCEDTNILSDYAGCQLGEGDTLGYLGDGFCDTSGPYNTVACGWDFGDCCPDTCNSTGAYVCGLTVPYACFDPASDFDKEPYPLPNGCSPEFPDWVGDGWCDGATYNTAECNYDGGDCCPGSCETNAGRYAQDYQCEVAGYFCLDPDPDQGGPGDDCANLFGGFPDLNLLGNGECNNGTFYNTEECGWDGGDWYVFCPRFLIPMDRQQFLTPFCFEAALKLAKGFVAAKVFLIVRSSLVFRKRVRPLWPPRNQNSGESATGYAILITRLSTRKRATMTEAIGTS
jgi:hypothetical protein